MFPDKLTDLEIADNIIEHDNSLIFEAFNKEKASTANQLSKVFHTGYQRWFHNNREKESWYEENDVPDRPRK